MFFPCAYLQMFSLNSATEHMRALRQSLIYFVQQIKTKNMASWFTCHGLRFHSAPALRGIPERGKGWSLTTTCRGLAAAAARFISVPGPVTALCDALEFKAVRGQLRGFRG